MGYEESHIDTFPRKLAVKLRLNKQIINKISLLPGSAGSSGPDQALLGRMSFLLGIKLQRQRAGAMAQWFGALASSCRGPEFDSHHPHGTQPSEIPVPEDPKLSSEDTAHTWFTDMHARKTHINTHKEKEKL